LYAVLFVPLFARGCVVSAVILKENHRDLFQEIRGLFHKWTDLERRIFAQAHYCGKSSESISSTLNVGVEEVGCVLRKCEQELHASLRDFREAGPGNPSRIYSDPSDSLK
jgi:hypothetical protein